MRYIATTQINVIKDNGIQTQIHRTVREELEKVIDPEIGLSIVTRGLLHEVHIQKNGTDTEKIIVTIGRTSLTCPYKATPRAHATAALRKALPGLNQVVVNLDLTGTWSPDHIGQALETNTIDENHRKDKEPSSLSSTGQMAWQRVPFLGVAMVSMLLGMVGGLIRMRVVLQNPTHISVTHHGALMVIGFLATLISVERAVAIGKRWGWMP